MKNIKISAILITVILISTVVFAVSNVNITRFEGYSDGENIILEWETSQEKNLEYFSVERKAANGNFVEIAKVEPEPDQFYEYVDENVYKSTSSIYIYNLKVKLIGESLQDASSIKQISVTHDVTGVKRTWGSIKALFR